MINKQKLVCFLSKTAKMSVNSDGVITCRANVSRRVHLMALPTPNFSLKQQEEGTFSLLQTSEIAHHQVWAALFLVCGRSSSSQCLSKHGTEVGVEGRSETNH